MSTRKRGCTVRAFLAELWPQYGQIPPGTRHQGQDQGHTRTPAGLLRPPTMKVEGAGCTMETKPALYSVWPTQNAGTTIFPQEPQAPCDLLSKGSAGANGPGAGLCSLQSQSESQAHMTRNPYPPSCDTRGHRPRTSTDYTGAFSASDSGALS